MQFASILAVTLTLVAFAALPDDSTFLKTLAEGGRVEVEAGELAANKGVSNDVRKFGLMMAKDHGAANQKIATVAKAKGLALPTAFSAEKTEMLNRLRKQEGVRFDQEYLAHMVAGHEKTLELLKSEIFERRLERHQSARAGIAAHRPVAPARSLSPDRRARKGGGVAVGGPLR